MKVKEESEKVGLRLNIQNTKIMASGPITSWQIDGETMETVTGFKSLGSKITADGDCSHEMKRRLLLGRKAMTNIDSILKNKDMTLPTKVCLVKAVVFPVVMYGCESWIIKKAERWRIDAFELWCWRILLSPLDCREIQPVHPKGNQSWIFTGRTDAEAETPILATWCKDLTHLKRPWCWERLKVGGEGDDRGWDGRMASPIQCTWLWVNSRCWWWRGNPDVLQSMGLQRVGHDWVTELKFTSLHRRRSFYLSSSGGKQDSVWFQLNHAPSQGGGPPWLLKMPSRKRDSDAKKKKKKNGEGMLDWQN